MATARGVHTESRYETRGQRGFQSPKANTKMALETASSVGGHRTGTLEKLLKDTCVSIPKENE